MRGTGAKMRSRLWLRKICVPDALEGGNSMHFNAIHMRFILCQDVAFEVQKPVLEKWGFEEPSSLSHSFLIVEKI